MAWFNHVRPVILRMGWQLAFVEPICKIRAVGALEILAGLLA